MPFVSIMKDPAATFNPQRAASYDQKIGLWTPSRDALFSLARLILAELPAEARVLCVGVGTGTEMIALAQAFRGWRFTATDPAGAMLDICRQKAHASGVASRCTFHEGFLDTLPASEPFHAATCFVVSHFFTQADERSQFFREIAERLAPGATLISSDLLLGMPAPVYQSVFEVWERMVRGSGWSAEEVEGMRAAYGTAIAPLSAPEVESIIADGGFESPALFFQSLFIRAWFSRRAA